jgi:endonuclease/exonuclease/phosphatase family metal-dependent hydrolase
MTLGLRSLVASISFGIAFALGLGCGGASGTTEDAHAQQVLPTAGVPLRVVAANISSGVNQSYDPGEGTRIFQTLTPDVVLIQELNYGDNSDAAIRTFVDGAFGTEFQVHRELGATIPNGVISRFPIVAHGEWADPGSSGTRDFAWARIDVPGARDLWAVSVHLKASTDQLEVRATQARALVAAIQANVPERDLLVVGGDFNTKTVDEPCLVTFGEVLHTGAPYAADADGNVNTNTNRNAPYDWVLPDADLQKLAVPVKLGSATFPDGLVFDTRVHPRLAEVPPARADDSAAVGMQHMAIVKDFVLR